MVFSNLYSFVVCLAFITVDSSLKAAASGCDDAAECPSPVLADRLPYVVSIQRPGSHQHICTGVLIDPQHVLTAAHCVDGDSLYSAGHRPLLHIGVKTASPTNSNKIEVYIPTATHIHDKWKETKNQNSSFNIALLKLQSKSKLSVPHLLPKSRELRVKELMTAVGWGPGSNGAQLGAEIFSEMKVEPTHFIDTETCNQTKFWNGGVEQGIVCGLNEDQEASCIVDSGSPLLLLVNPEDGGKSAAHGADLLLGVNIDGASCGTAQKPDVYVDLRDHADWILETISPYKDREL